ncbi:MAG: AMP-binding protein, partial [Pseudomonadota bacterium]
MTNPLFEALLAPHRESDLPFLVLDDGAAWRFRDFAEGAARLAQVLLDAGVEPGDRVAVQVAKSAHALALYAGCVQVGAVFLPLNTAYTVTELDYFIGDAEPRVVVVAPDRAEALSATAERHGARVLTLDDAGGGSLGELASNAEPCGAVTPRNGDDLAAILYTSGTTGRSKGAMLSQTNLLSNARTLVNAWQFDADDVLLHALPIFHTHGLFVASNICLLAGCRMVFLPGFSAERVLHWLPECTAMMGVPTFYTRLLDQDGFTREATAHMRLFVSGSAPLLAETHKLFAERTGHRILERYGMTETNMNTSNPYDGDRRPGTVGLPLPGVALRVCVPGTADAVPAGEVGVIEVRGDNVFSGYWNMPEKT